MEDREVNGLVDAQRAARILGINVNTFKVWATRSSQGHPGIPSHMPKEVGSLHGKVYRIEDIREFGRFLASSSRTPRTAQRSRGAYFTPQDAALAMAQWAMRKPSDTFIEPSLGDGQFALAVRTQAEKRQFPTPTLHGYELDESTANEAVKAGFIEESNIHVGDFMEQSHVPLSDVVIGNPPYVRVRELPHDERTSATNACLKAMGEPMDKAGSLWMPFVAKSTSHLKENGRLAFVLPLDFTYVAYARPLWRFLGENFGKITIVRSKQRIFTDILQNVLILLADHKGRKTSNVEIINLEHPSELVDLSKCTRKSIRIDSILDGQRPFQYALLPDQTIDVWKSLEPYRARADSRVKFNIGYVSGNKAFFHPSNQTIEEFHLPQQSLRPCLSSSRQLSRVGLLTSEIEQQSFLWLPREELTPEEKRYVEQGEHNGIDMAYKCRIRKPWYRVPGVRVPDLVVTTFSTQPRLHLNDAGHLISNSTIGGYMREGQDPKRLVESWYTPMTLLSTELQIHSLGGGVMIVVPREADSVNILKEDYTSELNFAQLDDSLRSSDPTAPYFTNNHSIERLVGKEGVQSLVEGAIELQQWRVASKS